MGEPSSTPESTESPSPKLRRERFSWGPNDIEIVADEAEADGLTKSTAERAEMSAGVLMATLIDELAPDGKCAGCDEEATLEVDHVNGRNWDPAELSKKQRALKYWEEYRDGVKLQALCRTCNASDGAKNKQGSRG